MFSKENTGCVWLGGGGGGGSYCNIQIGNQLHVRDRVVFRKTVSKRRKTEFL